MLSKYPLTSLVSHYHGALVMAIRQIIKRGDTRPTGLLVSVVSVGWGLVLLIPPWNTFGSASVYAVMNALANEIVWGAVFLLAGIAGIVAQYYSWLKLRKSVLMVFTALWGFVAVAMFLSNSGTTGVVTYSVLALASAWAYLRLSNIIRANGHGGQGT